MSEHFISRDQADGDLLAAAAFIAERIRSADGRAEAMNAIVPRYLARGNVDLAAELANTVDDPFFRDKLLLQVAAKCAALDDDEYATQLADAVEDEGMRSEAFERIGLIKAGMGQLDAARSVAGKMTHPDFVEAAIAIARADSGDIDGALETIGAIGFPMARVQALHQIAKKLIASADDRAIEMLDRAGEFGSQIEHIEEQVRAMCDTGNLQVLAKRFDKAIETFVKARDVAEQIENVHRDYFLGTCALGLLTAGSRDLADRTLDLITDKTHMSAALLGFAREEWKNEQKDEAVETLDEAFAIVDSQKENETRDSRSRNSLWTSLATQYAGFGKTERALEVAKQNVDHEETTNAITQIAQILVSQNENQLAVETAALLEDASERTFTLISVSDAQTERAAKETAVSTLRQATDSAGEIQQPSPRASAMTIIANRASILGLADVQAIAADAAVAAIGLIHDESRRAVSIAELGDIFVAASDLSPTAAEQVSRLIGSVDA